MAAVKDTTVSEPSNDASPLKGWASAWWQVARRSVSRVEAAGWWELAAYGSLLVAAATMRLWELGARAIHHDESLHAYFSWNLSQGVGFQHNPLMHGPFQFEANAAIFFLLGDSDFTARLLYVVLGVALVAMPFFLRNRLGSVGAVVVSGLLAFSPAMLYFSRFARNDIIMAAWTFGLVISMWRYLDEGKNRYLYISSALLALAFATKETAYLVTFILALFLASLVTFRSWVPISRDTIVGVVSPPVAAFRVGSALWSAFVRGIKQSQTSRPASFLILLVTLTLPQWSASVSVLQDTPLLSWSNLVLANPDGVSPVGAPSGGGLVIAFLVVVALLGLSVYWGFKWSWPVWWRGALIFYAVWVLLFTTFFTNIIGGISSGIWQSLGYWIAQQDVSRGDQPWYYYVVLTSIYEFLPLIFGVVASFYFLRKRDVFGYFLVYWSVTTFILYMIASEKMPWLLVNISLPLIVLSGRFLSDVIQRIEWRRLASGVGILTLSGVPLFLVLLWRLAFFDPASGNMGDVLIPLALATALVAMVAAGVYAARRVGARNFVASATVAVALVLLVLTVRASSTAAYQNGDVPVEMLVFVQTSPDITRLIREMERAGEVSGQQASVAIAIDQTSGFSWPWHWYLRGNTLASYHSYGDTPIEQAPDSSVLLIHSQNRSDADSVLDNGYTDGQLIRHRWWFPWDSTYLDLTVGRFLRGFVDRDSWRSAMDYFLYREGVRERIGSEDAYVYFAQEFPQAFSSSN